MRRTCLLAATFLMAAFLVPSAHAGTRYVETPRWRFSYSNDGLEGIVLRNVWYTSPTGETAQVAQWIAMEFYRVRYQDDAAGPYSDNFQLNAPQLYIGCPEAYEEEPEHLCTVYEGGCELDPTAPGCTDSSDWVAPAGGTSVCEQGSSAGEVRLTAQGGYNCGLYRFVETFVFHEDGTLSLQVSSKGIQATDRDGTSREHMHYAYFRLDVDADGAQNIVSVDGAARKEEASLDLGGLRPVQPDGSVEPIVFGFEQRQTGRSVWVWGTQSDPRDSVAYHGEATWTGWSQYDAWLHQYHREEMVGVRSNSLYGPPYGYCGGDELVEYEDEHGFKINREDILNDMAATHLVRVGREVVQVEGAGALQGSDPVLWLNAPLYHDGDPASTTHGCHHVEVQLRPSWGGCYPRAGEGCGDAGQSFQCDGSCM